MSVMPAVHISELWVWEIDKFVSFSLAMDEDAEKPGSLPHAGSIYAILKVLEFTLEALKEKT